MKQMHLILHMSCFLQLVVAAHELCTTRTQEVIKSELEVGKRKTRFPLSALMPTAFKQSLNTLLK